jgi:hypothetical protein
VSCVLAVYRHDSYRSGTLPVARQSRVQSTVVRMEVWRMCVLFACLGEAGPTVLSTTYFTCKSVHGGYCTAR